MPYFDWIMMLAYKWEVTNGVEKNIFYKEKLVFYRWVKESHGNMQNLTEEGDDQMELISFKLKDTLTYINMKTWLHKILVRTNIFMFREKEDILIEAICENQDLAGNIKKHIHLQAFNFVDEQKEDLVGLREFYYEFNVPTTEYDDEFWEFLTICKDTFPFISKRNFTGELKNKWGNGFNWLYIRPIYENLFKSTEVYAIILSDLTVCEYDDFFI